MRWWLVWAALGLLGVLILPDVQAGGRHRNHEGERRKGKRRRDGQGVTRTKEGRSKPLKIRLVPGPAIPEKPGGNQGDAGTLTFYTNGPQLQSSYSVIPGKQGQCVYRGLTMFDLAVWSPSPCVTCLCSEGRVVCDEMSCPRMHCPSPVTPAGRCCPVCMEPDSEFSLELSGDSSVPSDPSEPIIPLTQEEIQSILWREEEEHREEEERLRKKDEARKKRRRERKEREERQRKMVEERRREEEEALRLQLKKEEEEWRRQVEEEERRQEDERRIEQERRMEEERRRQEEERRREEEQRMEEERRRQQEEEQQREAKEEVEVWLRGDVFQMPSEEELIPSPDPTPPAVTEELMEEAEDIEVEEEVTLQVEEEEEEERETWIRGGLPAGCDISDVTMTCENANLNRFPPLSIPELKSLSLEGNNISSIPAEAFNGIPNLEWINLKKNKLTSAGINPKAFTGLKMLRRLYLDENLLDVVPPDLPPTLQELKINDNQLRGIDENVFRDLNNLVILELEGNLLSEGNVRPRAFAPLTQLFYLRLGRNYFRTIPQGLPKSLLELHLENNLIEEISETVLNQTTNLNLISLRHNKLDETRIAPMAWFNHRNLESIDLSHNDLYLVPSYLPKSLVHLVLVGNNIERIPGYIFAHMDPGLEYLYMSFNKLDGEGIEPESFFGAYHSMTEMCLDHNQLIHIPLGISEMTNLHFLRLDSNRIRSIPEGSICDLDNHEETNLVALRMDNNYIDPNKVSPAAFSCLRSASSVVLKPQKPM
ncbi:PREDICTED: extracellular matrix protein 2 isoform X1 [Cyprinodon variegatus]|uniref:Extracellular matrix protein 2 n=1 Tax=Cyprinodon variegatus TaxID=28743 RepID=A0A3Q2CRH6_CYPVA|nr:PREDICTED: extracellular matrix protein 2 isoform X1 [Cyprinodon variegatus]XP_015258069.1 PREDICTED: extracellular matrix protein 2 isoform X1 [Cyprinodon variegatus]